MKKLLIFTPLLLLLFLMGNANATVWDVPKNLSSALQLNVNPDIVRAKYINSSWIIAYDFVTAGTSRNIKVGKFDTSFLLIDGFDTINNLAWAENYRNFDFAIYPNESMCTFAGFNSGTSEVKWGNFTVNGLTQSSALTTLLGMASVTEVSMTSSWNYIRQNDSIAVVFGNSANLYANHMKDTAIHTLNIPSGITANKTTILYSPIWDNYILFVDDNIVGQEHHIYALYYEKDFDYLGYQDVSTINGTFSSADIIESAIFLTFKHNRTHALSMAFSVTSPTHLDAVYEEWIAPSNLDATITQNMTMDAPYLTYDGNRKLFLYFRVNDSGYDSNANHIPEGIYYMYENVSCGCTDWLNSTVDGLPDCIAGTPNRKQTRNCYPDLCDIEVKGIWDDYCNKTGGGAYPELYQQYQSKCQSKSCESDWLDVDDYSSGSCEVNLQLPQNATKLNISSIIQNEVQTYGLTSLMGDKRFWVLMCMPLDKCFNQSYLCSQTNLTLQGNAQKTYSANEQVIAHFELWDVKKCRTGNTWGLGGGWLKFKVVGTIDYCYSMLCGGRVCQKEGLIWKSYRQMPSCDLNYTDVMQCTSNSCENGICGELITTTIGISSPSGNPFAWIMKETSSQFGFDGGWFLSLISIFLTGGGVVYTGIISKNWIIALVVGMGILLFFIMLGWLPAWISLLWILSIAVIITNMFREKFVGK